MDIRQEALLSKNKHPKGWFRFCMICFAVVNDTKVDFFPPGWFALIKRILVKFKQSFKSSTFDHTYKTGIASLTTMLFPFYMSSESIVMTGNFIDLGKRRRLFSKMACRSLVQLHDPSNVRLKFLSGFQNPYAVIINDTAVINTFFTVPNTKFDDFSIVYPIGSRCFHDADLIAVAVYLAAIQARGFGFSGIKESRKYHK